MTIVQEFLHAASAQLDERKFRGDEQRVQDEK
jgi:hypothetical protein